MVPGDVVLGFGFAVKKATGKSVVVRGWLWGCSSMLVYGVRIWQEKWSRLWASSHAARRWTGHRGGAQQGASGSMHVVRG